MLATDNLGSDAGIPVNNLAAAPGRLIVDRAIRKASRRILPFLFACFVVFYLDRANIGFARLQFMHDLNLSEATFGMVAGVLFLGDVLFEIPSNVMLGRIGARRSLSRIMALWGCVTMLMMFATGATSLYVLRFLLGAAEAGFMPGCLLFLSLWFPNRVRGRITSAFIVCIPVAGIFGGPLSGWVMSTFDGVLGLYGWQWLFCLEGLPAIILGVACYLYLRDRPASAAWLSAEESAAITAELEADHETARRNDPAKAERDKRSAFRDPKLYGLAAIYFTIPFFNNNNIWMPALLHEVGVASVVTIGWLIAIVWVCAAIGMTLIGRHSDRGGDRRWYVVSSAVLAAGCYFALPWAANSVTVTVGLLAFGTIGGYGTLATFWTIPPTYLSPRNAVVGVAFVSAMGQLGGGIGPAVVGWLRQTTGSLYAGLDVIAAVLLVGMLLLLLTIPSTKPAPLSTVPAE